MNKVKKRMAGNKRTLSESQTSISKVKDQYEDFPYPHRNPQDELNRLILGPPGCLPEINHYLFAGKMKYSEPFRVLVAGGGTGDGLIMLAQQLADINCPAEIHYVDLSSASREIAEQRAKVRKLSNITFHTDSLLEVGSLGLFDYIDCCGVLHHLPDPQAGFKALAGMLASGGGMGVMVYGELGRIGVYHAQAMLQMIAGDGSGEERVALAKKLVAGLPSTNWLSRNPQITDHKRSDSSLYDLLLHSQDRAYTVPQLADEVCKAGLRIVAFCEPARYCPELYIKDPELLERLQGLTVLEQASFAELLAGNMRKHTVYLTAVENACETVANISPKAVPVFKDLETEKKYNKAKPGTRVTFPLDGLNMEVTITPHVSAIFNQIDGRKTLEQIRCLMPGKPDWLDFVGVFEQVFKVYNGFSELFICYEKID